MGESQWLQRFCSRLGFGDDIETAEQKRARRKGLRRATDLHLSGLSAASKKLRNHRKPTNSIVDNSGYVDMHQANSIKM